MIDRINLIDSQDMYTDLGAQVSKEIRTALAPLIKQYIYSNYSFVDLEYIISREVSNLITNNNIFKIALTMTENEKQEKQKS